MQKSSNNADEFVLFDASASANKRSPPKTSLLSVVVLVDYQQGLLGNSLPTTQLPSMPQRSIAFGKLLFFNIAITNHQW
jgi:hypothetical protein